MEFGVGQEVMVLRGQGRGATVQDVRPGQVLVQFESGESAWVPDVQLRARGVARLSSLRPMGRLSSRPSDGHSVHPSGGTSTKPPPAKRPQDNPYAAPGVQTANSEDSRARDWKHLFFSFEGRIGRANYWLGHLVMIGVPTGIGIAAALLIHVFSQTGGAAAASASQSTATSPATSAVSLFVVFLLTVFFTIPFLWASLALSVKRWHDRNKSGYWVLIGLIPYLGSLWTFIECGLMRGTPGTNRYGSDPLQ